MTARAGHAMRARDGTCVIRSRRQLTARRFAARDADAAAVMCTVARHQPGTSRIPRCVLRVPRRPRDVARISDSRHGSRPLIDARVSPRRPMPGRDVAAACEPDGVRLERAAGGLILIGRCRARLIAWWMSRQ
jgi:hypothetical protein